MSNASANLSRDEKHLQTKDFHMVEKQTDAAQVKPIVSRASWFNIRWIDEPWTVEELKKAVEIQTALAWWFAQNDHGTPIPDWGYLFDPIDKAEILELWDEWNAERTSG